MINIDYAEELINKYRTPSRNQQGAQGSYVRDPNNPVAEPTSGTYEIGGQKFMRDPNEASYIPPELQGMVTPGQMVRDPNDPRAIPNQGAFEMGGQTYAPSPEDNQIGNIDDLRKYLQAMGVDPEKATKEQIASAFGGNVQAEMQPEQQEEKKGLLDQSPYFGGRPS